MSTGTLERHLTASRCTLSVGDSVLLNLNSTELTAAGIADDFGEGGAKVDACPTARAAAIRVCRRSTHALQQYTYLDIVYIN